MNCASVATAIWPPLPPGHHCHLATAGTRARSPSLHRAYTASIQYRGGMISGVKQNTGINSETSPIVQRTGPSGTESSLVGG